MKLYKLLFVFLLVISISYSSKAQQSIADSSINLTMAQVGYGFHIPGGDLADRFGVHNTIGGAFMWKMKSNIQIGFDFDYIFGGDVKEDDILSSISSEANEVLDKNGIYAEVFAYERGFRTSLKIGYLIPVYPKYNSGILIMGSVGLLQHKIRIENTDNTAPQISYDELNDVDYRKGYDRLSNGLCVTEFIGYQLVNSSQFWHFYGGFEFTQAWTQNRRSWNFDQRIQDTQPRYDYSYGVKVGWIIPIYKRAVDNYFYY